MCFFFSVTEGGAKNLKVRLRRFAKRTQLQRRRWFNSCGGASKIWFRITPPPAALLESMSQDASTLILRMFACGGTHGTHTSPDTLFIGAPLDLCYKLYWNISLVFSHRTPLLLDFMHFPQKLPQFLLNFPAYCTKQDIAPQVTSTLIPIL